ncbi:AraC family transcriptional regulator [Pedobacter sp.]|jgi:AraC-like DNA-binding protein|uniref:AraC family transcriptional regulator n=1 Tax=Pedobacter sp. TaxID=1411316 RepID=UPI002D17FDE1|nr:AraC family transcriptional regulator [Pedobacter sp.]HWW40418.1 AraC family transcriptional regulator [Pedobacter sp.]
MVKENLYQPFEIDFKEVKEFPKAVYRNNFFKLIYIVDGTGIQYINQYDFNYRKGNLFLITPEDSYSFIVEEKTTFFFLSFHDIYIRPKDSRENDWVQRMEYILQNASHRPGCILKNKVDKPLIASLVQAIFNEHTFLQIYHVKIIQQIVNTLLLVVARNIALKLPKNVKENTGEAVLDILHYIQQNIFEQGKLRSETISQTFGISLTYLGRYFKKQTGETLQQYISNYKLRLIETRLLHSDMRINEIANELNFTDESHLHRIFKKYKGLSPSEYRKKYA